MKKKPDMQWVKVALWGALIVVFAFLATEGPDYSIRASLIAMISATILIVGFIPSPNVLHRTPRLTMNMVSLFLSSITALSAAWFWLLSNDDVGLWMYVGMGITIVATVSLYLILKEWERETST